MSEECGLNWILNKDISIGITLESVSIEILLKTLPASSNRFSPLGVNTLLAELNTNISIGLPLYSISSNIFRSLANCSLLFADLDSALIKSSSNTIIAFFKPTGNVFTSNNFIVNFGFLLSLLSEYSFIKWTPSKNLFLANDFLCFICHASKASFIVGYVLSLSGVRISDHPKAWSLIAAPRLRPVPNPFCNL